MLQHVRERLELAAALRIKDVDPRRRPKANEAEFEACWDRRHQKAHRQKL